MSVIDSCLKPISGAKQYYRNASYNIIIEPVNILRIIMTLKPIIKKVMKTLPNTSKHTVLGVTRSEF